MALDLCEAPYADTYSAVIQLVERASDSSASHGL